jgi:hypothetical protein
MTGTADQVRTAGVRGKVEFWTADTLKEPVALLAAMQGLEILQNGGFQQASLGAGSSC